MKAHLEGGFRKGAQSVDCAAFFIGPRIAIRGHHDGHRVIISPVHGGVGQTPLGAGLQQVQRLSPQTQHQHLTFRIAKAAVIFDQARLPVLDHETRIQHALIGGAAIGHDLHRGADDFGHRLGGDFVGQDGGRGIGAHAAGVQAGVAFADAFMVLRCADGQALFAIDEDEIAGLFAIHEFLDHDLGASGPEFTAKHVVNRGQGGVQIHRDDHAFASGQAVGLDHDGRALFADIGLGGVSIGEMRIACGGRVGGVANLFGEGFRGLQSRGLFRGAKDAETRIAQIIRDASGQGGLGADDHEINRVFLGEIYDGDTVFNVQAGAISDGSDPGIARRHDQLVTFGVLHDGPCQCVFASAAAQDQDIHAMSPLGLSFEAF